MLEELLRSTPWTVVLSLCNATSAAVISQEHGHVTCIVVASKEQSRIVKHDLFFLDRLAFSA